jgi:hypothetical protein
MKYKNITDQVTMLIPFWIFEYISIPFSLQTPNLAVFDTGLVACTEGAREQRLIQQTVPLTSSNKDGCTLHNRTATAFSVVSADSFTGSNLTGLLCWLLRVLRTWITL